MRIVDIITKKREGHELSEEEIRFFVNGYVDGSVKDYQASALCMAIVFNGMNKHEIATLTDAMMHSGDIVDLSDINGVKVDKHSTGGVGDKTSLVLGPIVASCGAKLAKMSGRGLGHTGGTLDKLESIPGFNVFLSEEQFKKQVNEIGISIIGQTASLVPADKKLYALRDVTGTVESIPLIASSIMSKKLASGSDAILLDVKVGSGAFMKDIFSARKLASTLVEIGDSLKRDTRAIITEMEEPLGCAVGNALEVKEAIATLHGQGPNDFTELCLTAASIMLEQAHIAKSFEEGKKMALDAINSGRAFNKLKEFVKYQGGDVSYIEDPSKFILSSHIIDVFAHQSGYVKHIDALAIGDAAMVLGAGRIAYDDVIDMSAGVILNKKVGDKVNKGEVLATIHTNISIYDGVIRDIEKAYQIVEEAVSAPQVVKEYIRK